MGEAEPKYREGAVSLLPIPLPGPPPRPQGWPVGPPDFVGVGAQRCGTTWWHRLIVAHPGVSFVRRAYGKELHFFDTLDNHGVLAPEEIDRYHLHFPRPLSGELVGEWTPEYMYEPWVPPQLAQAAPDARVLVLLRDPVDRYASGLARARRLASEQAVGGLDAELAARHLARGMYFEQVRRLLELFPADRVLVLQYERCREQRRAELRRTYEFLGLDPELGPTDSDLVAREPRERSLPTEERMRLAALYAPDTRKLGELLPELDLSLWRSVADQP